MANLTATSAWSDVLGTGATQKTTTACRIVSGYAHSASLLDSSDISAAILDKE